MTKQEKRILRRLNRAPEDAIVPDLDRIYRIELAPEGLAVQAVKEYSMDTDVEYAELNYVVYADLEPNDPLYNVQWPLNNIGQMYPESGNYNPPPRTLDCDIDAPEAWDIHIGSPEIIVAVSGGTYSLFNQVGKAIAKQFIGRLGLQLVFRLLFSFGSFSMSALYDTLYDSWMIKREIGRWPSGSQFMTLYKINLAINCIGFVFDASQITLQTKYLNAIGEFSSAKSRKAYRHVYSGLTKDQKMLERAAGHVMNSFDSRWAASISTISANVAQQITKEEWEDELALDE